jgi:hypothetical protein
MTGNMTGAFSLDSTYIHLKPDEGALAMEGGAKFWAGMPSAATSTTAV